jgi:hypothetical protein
MAQSHAFRELMADKSLGRVETVKGLPGFVLIPVDTDEDSGHLAARSKHNLRDGNQADSRVTQFTFQDQIDFFPKSPHSSLALMLRSAWFYHKKLQKIKLMSIAEDGAIGDFAIRDFAIW